MEKIKPTELRVKTPKQDNIDYVYNLAVKNNRSIPKQIETIIEEHRKLKRRAHNIEVTGRMRGKEIAQRTVGSHARKAKKRL